MKHEIDLLDDEYTTPQQAAEIRRMKAELPLWQQVEAMEPFDFRQPAATTDATSDVTAQLLAGTDLHRALNGTTGMESEE